VWLEEGYYYTPRAHHITQQALEGESRKVDTCTDMCRNRVKLGTVVLIGGSALLMGVAGGMVAGITLQ